jgi:acyl-CoA synthetase (AMP-forming)/AMP-acid ligase II/acyl carrier protein
LFPTKLAFINLEANNIERKIDYSNLLSDVQKLAYHLNNHNLQNERVILIYNDTIDFIIAFLACQYVGSIPVPVYFSRGKKYLERIKNILDDTGAKFIFSNSQIFSEQNYSKYNIISTLKNKLIFTNLFGEVENFIIPDYYPSDIAFLQYTSGSTSNPKGVIVTKNSLMHNQELIKNAFNCNEDSVIFSWLPFHHDMGLIGNILHSIFIGCTCILMSPLDFISNPKKWLQGITKYRASHSGGPNFSFDHCVDKIDNKDLVDIDLSSWKVAYNGSEPIKAETMDKFVSKFKATGFKKEAFFPCYGLAEATLLVTSKVGNSSYNTLRIDEEESYRSKIKKFRIDNNSSHLVTSSGSFIDGMKLKIVSLSNVEECKELEEGEVCIQGESVCEGYWNHNTEELYYYFNGERYLRTGDLGFVYNTELYVLGRIKETFIIRGKNFYALDVENPIGDIDEINRNGIVCFALENTDECIVVVAELKRYFVNIANFSDIIKKIERHVIETLGILPFDVILVPQLSIPRTTSGKLQRAKCRKNYLKKQLKILFSKLSYKENGLKDNAHSIALKELILIEGNKKDIKQYLINLITIKIGKSPDLNDPNIRLDEIGVDSLRAMELINTLNNDFDISLDATVIFEDNTLNAIVNAIENLIWLKQKTLGGEIIL